MKIINIEKKNELLKHLDNIIKLYITVFSAPPRKETIVPEEIKEELIHIINSNGIILIAKKDNRVIGLSTAIVFSKYKDYELMGINEEGWFHSDTAVHPDYQGNGIGKILFKEREKLMKNKMNLKYRYTRTRTDSFSQIAILEQEDFKIINKMEFVTNGERSIKYVWRKEIFS